MAERGPSEARRTALRDAYKARERQAAWTALTLDRPALDALLDHLDAQLAAEGCDHSLRFTEGWAARRGRPPEQLVEALHQAGGYCDCEVLANVDPEG